MSNRAVSIGNTLVIAAMTTLWMTPMLSFWGAAFGPLRPFSIPAGDYAPRVGKFILTAAACFVPLLIPAGYFNSWDGPLGMQIYELLGVRIFKRLATNGDLINRLARKVDPDYHFVRNCESLQKFRDETISGERGHLVLLLMGVASSWYAFSIGWPKWAIALTLGNLVFNLYPIFLLRYNRIRADVVLRRRSG